MIFRSSVLLSSMRPFDLLETIQRNTLVSSLDLQSSKLREMFSMFVECRRPLLETLVCNVDY